MASDFSSVSIKEFQQIVDNWIQTVGNGYFSPLTNTAILAEETGEVASIMARRFGEQSFKPNDISDLGDELADVIWVVAALANQTGVDLCEAIARNIDKKTKRDATRHRNNPKLKDKQHQ